MKNKMPGGFNMGAMMKQAQKLQKDMADLQAELETREYTASSGGGAVTAVVAGKLVKSLTISEEVVDPQDIEMLCDLVTAAVNEALSQAEQTAAAEMQKLTGGMPGLF